jgi:hypothetical protein
MIHLASGNMMINKDVIANEKVRETLEKHDIELKEGETPIGCYVCPAHGLKHKKCYLWKSNQARAEPFTAMPFFVPLLQRKLIELRKKKLYLN